MNEDDRLESERKRRMEEDMRTLIGYRPEPLDPPEPLFPDGATLFAQGGPDLSSVVALPTDDVNRLVKLGLKTADAIRLCEKALLLAIPPSSLVDWIEGMKAKVDAGLPTDEEVAKLADALSVPSRDEKPAPPAPKPSGLWEPKNRRERRLVERGNKFAAKKKAQRERR